MNAKNSSWNQSSCSSRTFWCKVYSRPRILICHDYLFAANYICEIPPRDTKRQRCPHKHVQGYRCIAGFRLFISVRMCDTIEPARVYFARLILPKEDCLMPTSSRAESHAGNDLYREIILPTTQT